MVVAADLAAEWLQALWVDRQQLLELLLCEAFDLNPAGQPPGTLLRQLTRGGAVQFDQALAMDLPAALREGGVLRDPLTLGGQVDLERIFPGLSSTAAEGQPAVLGFERVFEDRFSGFTAGWAGDGTGGGQLLLSRAWAEHATVFDLVEMLLEKAGHWLQERLGLPEPRGDEGKIFAEGILRLQAGLVPEGASRVVPQGTVAALRLRDDAGYLFADGTGASALLSLELGELSDQFFERFTRVLANGEVPLLDLSAGAADAVRAAFGFNATGLISAGPAVERDSYASRLLDGPRAYAVDQSVVLRSDLIDGVTNLLRLTAVGVSPAQRPEPGSWDRNDFGFQLGPDNQTRLSQPLVLNLQTVGVGAGAQVRITRADGTVVLDAGVRPTPEQPLYAVPFWTAADPGLLLGYKLFEEAPAALALFRALTAVVPQQSAIDAAAATALRLSAIEGAADPAAADRLVLDANRHYGLWGWQPETIRDHLRIEAIYGVTPESGRAAATDPFGETSPSGFMASHVLLRGTGALTPTGGPLPAADDDFWLGAMVRPASSYPILAFQGTDNLAGVLDDANPLGVGIIQYLTNVGQIMADLTAWSLPGLADGSLAPPSFTGNSLGAALAQQFALTALDPLGTLAGIEANLLSGPLALLATSLDNLAGQPITASNWLGLLGAGVNIAILADLLSGDNANDAADGPGLSDQFAALGADLVASLQGYARAIANLAAAGADGSGLPVYRVVALHAPGIQDWQFDALRLPWDSQRIADVSFQLSIGDVVGLAGDLHLPGEVSFRGFDPLRNAPHLPRDLDALLSGLINLHSNLAFHPVGITAYSGLAEAAGEQLIQLIDNQIPLRLEPLPAPRPDALGIQRIGVLPTPDTDSATGLIAGFGSSAGNFDDSADLNWLLHRQQLLHVVGMVDDFVALLRRLMEAPPRPGDGEVSVTSRTASIDLGAFNTRTDLLRIDDPALRAHIGAGRSLAFSLAAGTRLPSLAAGSPVPRGWSEGRPQALYLRPTAAGSAWFEVYAGTDASGRPVDRLDFESQLEILPHIQRDFLNSGAFLLPPAERAELDRLVASIAAGNQTVAGLRISASTDPEPLSANLANNLAQLGYEASNRGLAVARAEAMRSYLLERLAGLPGLDPAQLAALLPPVPRRPEANAGARRYSDATYTLAWEQGSAPRDPSARFVEASFQLERRLLGAGTLLTSWTTSERQPSDQEGLNLDLGDLLCRFTASYGVQDLRLLYNLLFPEADQGAATDSPFWEGASGEALAAGLLLWGYDNALQSAGDRGMFSRILDRIPNLEELVRQALSSREQTELVRSGAIPGITGELLAALSDPAVSLLPLWLAPEDGFRFNSIGNSIASAAALAATPGVLLDLYNLIERTSFDLDLCDLICAIDLVDGLPPLLADPAARATAATLLAENEVLASWFFALAKAPSDRILRLDPRAWPILDAFNHGTLSQWQQLAELSPRVWTAIRRFDFDDYGRQVLEAIRAGDAPALAGLTSWDLSTLRCVLAGLALFTDAVADQLESSLLGSATLAPLISEADRQRYAASLSQPLRNLQSGLLQMGPLLPQQLVQQLQLLLDQSINTPLGLTGNQRVVARGSLPNLEALPAGAGAAPYWLELDFSGLRTSVSLPLPIEALVSSALGVAPAGLPVLSAELTAQLQGGLRFGIDLATAVPSQALLLDTNGTLQAFDGTRAELLAGFSATLSLDPAYSPPGWLAGINLTDLVRLDGAAYLDLVSLADDPRLGAGVLPLAEAGQGLELRADAALSLRFAREGDAAALFESFSQAVSEQLTALGNALAIGSPGACPAAWLAFVDRFIGLVSTLSGRVDQLPALPAWLPAEAAAASRGLATGLRQVAGQLERFRSQVLDAENFVGLVNGLFADAAARTAHQLGAGLLRPAPHRAGAAQPAAQPRSQCAREQHRRRRHPAPHPAGRSGRRCRAGGASPRCRHPSGCRRPGPGALPQSRGHRRWRPAAGAGGGWPRCGPQHPRSRPLPGAGGRPHRDSRAGELQGRQRPDPGATTACRRAAQRPERSGELPRPRRRARTEPRRRRHLAALRRPRNLWFQPRARGGPAGRDPAAFGRSERATAARRRSCAAADDPRHRLRQRRLSPQRGGAHPAAPAVPALRPAAGGAAAHPDHRFHRRPGRLRPPHCHSHR